MLPSIYGKIRHGMARGTIVLLTFPAVYIGSMMINIDYEMNLGYPLVN